MARAFRKLRCKLVEMDIQQKELADQILGIPLDQLSVFFYDDSPESLAARKKALCRAT